MDHIIQDLRVAFKQAGKKPGITLIALLTLAIGIGPNTALFSLIDAIILRPLPFHRPQELVQIRRTVFPKGWLLALRNHTSSFDSLAAYTRNEEVNLTRQNQSDRIGASYVSANFFDVLGAKAMIGRVFVNNEDTFGQDRQVVLSYGLWQQNFGGDPRIIGESVEIENISRQVIGVMPPHFHFPVEQIQMWMPNSIKMGNAVDLWAVQNLFIFGRLKAGGSPSKALSELKLIQPQLNSMFPWSMPSDFGANVEVTPLSEVVQGNVRPRLLILFGTVALVLLIACGNIAGLFLGQAASRKKEVAVRRALGARKKRLFQQFLTEGMLFALCGGGLGSGIGWVGITLLKNILPPETPRLAEAHLNLEVLAFTFGLSVLVGLFLGLVPAFAFLGQDIQRDLKDNAANVSAKPLNTKFLSWLVVGQVALAVVIVAGTGVTARSFWKLLRKDPGYRTANLVFAKVALDKTACKSPGRCEAFVNSLLDNMRSQSRVEAVAAVNQPVLHGANMWFGFDAEGHPRGPRDALPQGVEHIVSKDYFQVMGIPLIAGRGFTDADSPGSGGVVVVNAALAQRFWPSVDATGKHVTPIVGKQSRMIIGVVGDTKHTALENEGGYEVYVPFGATDVSPVMTVVLRTSADKDIVSGQLRSVIARLDRSASMSSVEDIKEVIDASTSTPHAVLVLLVLFSSIALILGMMGIYSMNYCLVSWRIREIGIRMALGASPGNVKKNVLVRGILVVGAGVLFGMLLAAGATQLFKSYLFEVSPLDPLTFAMIPVLFVTIALIANWIPARRAAATDPVQSLRHE